jgi:carotenoid cleavage dioxygenase-like enzyme
MILILIQLTALHLPRPPLSRGRGFATGWKSATKEYLQPVEIKSDFPRWLNGVLIRNGPALFEVGTTRVNHQFDGFAKLNKFNFSNGNMYYQSRFLQSSMYNNTMKRNRLIPHVAMVPTIPRFRYIDRIRSLFSKQPLDNNNINVHKNGDTLYATSDSSASSVFDMNTLQTLKPLHPSFTRHISAAHPQKEVNGNDTINYICDPSTLLLRIYRDSDVMNTRTFIGRIRLKHLPLIHSFAVTEDYVIIFHYPLHMNPMALISGASSAVEIMRWMKRDVVAFVFNVKATYSAPPLYKFYLPSFFSMHCINAYQEKCRKHVKLVIDLISYPDAEFVASEDTYGQLDLMRDPSLLLTSKSHKMMPKMSRIQMKLKPCKRGILGKWTETEDAWEKTDDIVCTMFAIASLPFEMPNINERQRGFCYQYVYGVTTSRMFQKWGITKTAVDCEHQSQKWCAPPNHFPTEPIFVEFPHQLKEDDGILLSLVLDARQNSSYVLCLDARTLTEITRAYLPDVIPFDVHGRWFASPSQNDGDTTFPS